MDASAASPVRTFAQPTCYLFKHRCWGLSTAGQGPKNPGRNMGPSLPPRGLCPETPPSPRSHADRKAPACLGLQLPQAGGCSEAARTRRTAPNSSGALRGKGGGGEGQGPRGAARQNSPWQPWRWCWLLGLFAEVSPSEQPLPSQVRVSGQCHPEQAEAARVQNTG